MKKIFGLILSLGLLMGLSGNSLQAQVKIRWFGHSCFLITSKPGTKILIDPFNPQVGYPIPRVAPELVLVSHEHFDHNYVQMAQGNPRIIRGLNPQTKDWNQVDEKFKDLHIYTVPCYHDPLKGKLRGKNSILVIEVSGIRIVHLGDLGHLLSPEQVKKIGRVDVLMIPVGGVYTIDAKQADQVINQLNPKLIFPMHYKTEVCKLSLNGLEGFINGKDNVKEMGKNLFVINKLPEKPEIIVLSWK